MRALGSEYLRSCFFEKELYFILSEIRNIYLWNTLLFCITKTVLGPTQNQNPFAWLNDAPNHLAQILKRLKTIAIYRWTSLPIITLWVTQLRQICRLSTCKRSRVFVISYLLSFDELICSRKVADEKTEYCNLTRKCKFSSATLL